jgi:putative intracellular protease/amidase
VNTVNSITGRHFVCCALLLFAVFWGQTQSLSNAGPAAAPDSLKSTLKLSAPKDGRTRPLIVVLADNAGTETTDFIIPYGILKESGVADVVTVSITPGTVELHPALRIRTDMTIAQFDATAPSGADILIVPAIHNSESPVILDWVRAQSGKGAALVSICEGAWVIANAGLLAGKTATTHWFALKSIASKFPETTWVRDRRWVVDGNVMTTTGVTASVPAALAIVESIAGQPAAELTARRLGVKAWGAYHQSSAFALTPGYVWTIVSNWLTFWRHEIVEIPVKEEIDEIAVALAADAWSRTYRSRAVAIHAGDVVRSRRGLRIETGIASQSNYVLPTQMDSTTVWPDATLDNIATRYGRPTANLVALLMEYRRRESGSPEGAARRN